MNPTYKQITELQRVLELPKLHPEVRACCQRVLDKLLDEPCHKPSIKGFIC